MKLRQLSVVVFIPFLISCVDELKEKTWNEIKPDGAVCSDGSPYMFFAMPGTKNNVVIDFQGGGGCWNDDTCNIKSTSYDKTVEDFDKPTPTGIYNREHAKNPVKDWNHVFLPYCTGDVHTGNNVALYNNPDGSTFKVNHKGAVNARASLDWIYRQFPNPKTVFVTGCSAGAYASIFYVPEIKKNYPHAKIIQMGDCGAGIATDNFAKTIAKQWNISASIPDNIESLNPNHPKFKFDSHFFRDFYSQVGKKFPNTQLSQFNTKSDGTQIGIYALGKGERPPTQNSIQEWVTGLQSSIKTISQNTSNFDSYISSFDDNADPQDGTGHCITWRPEFYTVSESGVSISDWVTDMLNGKDVDSVEPKN